MFGMHPEHYRELGVHRNASIAEIKAAFRRKAMRWHPDRNKDVRAEEVFKRIKVAYEVLSDAARRRAYDAETPSRPSASQETPNQTYRPRTERRPPPQTAWEAPPRPQSRASNPKLKGRELRRNIEISLEMAVGGGKFETSFYAGHVCASCAGEGEITGYACLHCFGSGRIRNASGGWINCPECHDGKRARALCPDCLGTGLIQKLRHLRVSLPHGLAEDAILRLRNAGTESRSGGPRGDVLLQIKLGPHRHYRVKGLNLYANLQVDFARAWLGGCIRVRTLHGPTLIETPALRHGPVILRFTGLGLPDRRSGETGDLLVRISDGRPKVAGWLPLL